MSKNKKLLDNQIISTVSCSMKMKHDRFKYVSRFSTRYFEDLLDENPVISILETTALYKTQNHTHLRDTLMPKLMSGEVRVKLEEEEAVYE